jgi:hypothetical protein
MNRGGIYLPASYNCVTLPKVVHSLWTDWVRLRPPGRSTQAQGGNPPAQIRDYVDVKKAPKIYGLTPRPRKIAES